MDIASTGQLDIKTTAGNKDINIIPHGTGQINIGSGGINIMKNASTTPTIDAETDSGNVTLDNARTGSIEYTFYGALANGAEAAETTTLSSNQITATSIIIANASLNVDIRIHTVINGSFKFNVINKSGVDISDDATMIINYAIL